MKGDLNKVMNLNFPDDLASIHIMLSEFFTFDRILLITSVILKLLFVYIVTKLFIKGAKSLINGYVERVMKRRGKYKKSEEDITPLIQTAAPVLLSIVRLIILAIGLLMAIKTVGFDITPIIYSFGAAGIAIGLAAQDRVKDVINGILMLFEGNLAVGEFVTLKGVTGFVENITLRSVHIRQTNGTIQTIPFSAVVEIINHSRDFQLASFKVTISHEQNFDEIETIFKDIYSKMMKDPAFKDLIIVEMGPLKVMKIDVVGSNVASFGRVHPDPFKAFEREFQKHIQRAIESGKILTPNVKAIASQGN